MLKKFALPLIFTAVIFTACGTETQEPDAEAAAETQTAEARPTPAPGPSSSEVQPPETQRSVWPPVPETVTHIIDDGVLGVKFSIDLPGEWRTEWGRNGNLTIHSGGHQGGTLISYVEWHDTYGGISFEISEGIGHPSDWHRLNFQPIALESGLIARLEWQQPEPTEVFITEAGLTVVKYISITERWMGWDLESDEWVAWDWAEGNPPERYGDFITALYKFRADGRDYREVPGAQIFYYVLVSAYEKIFGEYNETARAAVESLRFLEGAAISLEPSEAARAIGITGSNYPRINGSTSTIPLVQRIFMSMFNHTQERGEWAWDWHPYWILGAARTIPAYELLIAEYFDLILVPDPSDAALQLARDAGVELEFFPVAAEALVFITSSDNPVSEITTQQILDIYADMSITNWAQVGGYDGRVVALNRNPHSGSQTLMDNMALQGREVHPLLSDYQIGGMLDMLGAINYAWILTRYEDPNNFALGYTVYFYLRDAERQGWARDIQVLSLDGIFPTPETIISGEYPLSTNYFAVIRADTPDDHPARKLVNWLLTDEGQGAVHAAGLGRIR